MQAKKIVRIDPATGDKVRYDSITEAARRNYCTQQCLSAAVRGVTNEHRAIGYIWYYDDTGGDGAQDDNG